MLCGAGGERSTEPAHADPEAHPCRSPILHHPGTSARASLPAAKRHSCGTVPPQALVAQRLSLAHRIYNPLRPMTDLPTLARDLDRIGDVPASDLPRLIGEAEALRAALWSRLQAASVPAPVETPRNGTGGPDALLTVQEAADLLGVSKRWVYRKADDLPFTRRLSGGTLRFSRKGLDRWKESRR